MAEQMVQHKADELAAKKTIPAGYKQTEVGVIPEDWKVDPLGVLINQIEYGSSAKSSSLGQVPVLRMGNLQDGQIDWGDLVYTNNDYEISKYELNDGDVLFNRTNSIDLVGKTALYKGIKKAIFAGYLIRIKVDPQCLDARYLNYFLNTPTARNYGLSVVSVGVSQANINSQKLKSYPIPYPAHVEEQVSIATALSDTDALITGLEQLIAKKQAIKTATMQQLLTGRTRLPPFSKRSDGTPKGYKQSELGQIPEDWETSLLGGLADKIMVGIASAATHAYCKSGIPMLRNQNVKPNRLDSNDLLFINKEYEMAFKNKRLKAGDLLTARTGYPGTTCIIPDDFENAQSFTTLITRPTNKVNSKFLAIFMNSEIGVDFFDKNQIGGGQKNINASTLRTFIVAAPKLEEQTAIATIISDMDMEIVALEEKLAKTRDLKQGMMQQLLTGRIRLQLPKEV